MEEERLKMLGTSHVPFVTKENKPKSNKNNRGQKAKKVIAPLRMVGRRLELPRNRRPKVMK